MDEVLRKRELEKGYRLANSETDKWLNDDEWESHVISVIGKRVRIIIVLAKIQYQGAFSRLITNILQAGLRPSVISPMMDMPLILTWWGWKQHSSGTAFEDREDYWIPTKEWINNRRKLKGDEDV